MKYADAISLHKKDDETDKATYRPISILPNLSKVYESPYFDALFSKFQREFRKGFNAQNCFFTEGIVKLL